MNDRVFFSLVFISSVLLGGAAVITWRQEVQVQRAEAVLECAQSEVALEVASDYSGYPSGSDEFEKALRWCGYFIENGGKLP